MPSQVKEVRVVGAVPFANDPPGETVTLGNDLIENKGKEEERNGTKR